MVNKKGVSPLIATVLLIAFAVALGAVVMSWGKGYVEQQTQNVEKGSNREIGCASNVHIDWYERDNTKQVCVGNGYVFFIVENGPNVDLANLRLVIDGENDFFTNATLLNETLPKGGVRRFNVTYDNATYGIVKQINVFPQVDISGDKYECQGQGIWQANPRAC